MVCKAAYSNVPYSCPACGGRVRVQTEMGDVVSWRAPTDDVELIEPDPVALAWELVLENGVPEVGLEDLEIDPELAAEIPRDMAEAYVVIPVARVGDALILAMADPSNLLAYEAVRSLTGARVEVVMASDDDILEAIARSYPPS